MSNQIQVTEQEFEKASKLVFEASRLYYLLQSKANNLTGINGSLFPGFWRYSEAALKARSRLTRRCNYAEKLVRL